MVLLEIAILHRLQAADQQRWQLLKLDHAALFLFGAVQRGDARGIEPDLIERVAGIGIAQARNRIRRQHDRNAARRFATIDVDQGAARNQEAFAVARVTAGQLCVGRAHVARGFQFQLKRVGRHRHADTHRQRARVDAAGQIPGQIVETRAHLAIQIHQIRRQKADGEPQRQPARGA